MDAQTTSFFSFFSSVNLFGNKETPTPSILTPKILAVTALMEIGLHPLRGDTKYFHDKKLCQLKPMVAENYTFNLVFTKIPTQWAYRKLLSSSSNDLTILDDKFIEFIRRYLWDPVYKDNIIVFLKDIVLPGLESLKITYKTKDFNTHIDLWITTVKCAITEPCTYESFSLEITKVKDLNLHHSSSLYYLHVLNSSKLVDTDFGQKIKKLLSLERLQRINDIYTQTVILPENASSEVISDVTKNFNQIIIQTVQEQIDKLQEDFLNLNEEAVCETSEIVEKPVLPSTAPVEIPRPGGAKPYVKKNSINSTSLDEKSDKTD